MVTVPKCFHLCTNAELHQQLTSVYAALAKVTECLYDHILCHGNQSRDALINDLLELYTTEKTYNRKTKVII